MHAWELGNASFDYFFFKENCSYHLLALLDYADPTLHLTDEFLFGPFLPTQSGSSHRNRDSFPASPIGLPAAT